MGTSWVCGLRWGRGENCDLEFFVQRDRWGSTLQDKECCKTKEWNRLELLQQSQRTGSAARSTDVSGGRGSFTNVRGWSVNRAIMALARTSRSLKQCDWVPTAQGMSLVGQCRGTLDSQRAFTASLRAIQGALLASKANPISALPSWPSLPILSVTCPCIEHHVCQLTGFSFLPCPVLL